MYSMLDSLRGALMLARFDKRGLGAFDGSIANARYSFRVVYALIALYVLGAAAIGGLIGNPQDAVSTSGQTPAEAMDQAGLAKVATLAMIGQVIAWIGLLLFMNALLKKGGLGHRFATAVAVFNWTLFWRRLFELVPVTLYLAGIMNEELVQLFKVLLLGYVLAYLFFAMRTALDGRGFEASMIVLMDAMLSLIVPILPLMLDPEGFQNALDATGLNP